MTVSPAVWQPFTLGRFDLSHRLALAPMTRSRAEADGTPGELVARYYAQRASWDCSSPRAPNPRETARVISAPRASTYLHVHHLGDDDLLASLRQTWPTAVLVVRYGRDRDQIGDDIDAGLADLAPLGRFALANPDVVERLRSDAPLNEVDAATVYTGTGEAGYTDYPTLT